MPDWLARAHADGLVSVCLYGDNVAGRRRAGAGCCADASTTGCRGSSSPSTRRAATSPACTTRRLARRRQRRARAARRRGDDARRGGRHRRRARRHTASGSTSRRCVDVNSSPGQPGHRRAQLRRRRRTASVGTARPGSRACSRRGSLACAKHFPGHGDTVVDSHHGLPRVDVPLDVLRERELAPFRAAVEAGVATVMTSHIVVEALDPERPATFSPAVLGRPARRARLHRRHRQRRPRHGRRERADRHPGGRGPRPRRRGGPPVPRVGTTEERYAGVHAAVARRRRVPAGSRGSGWPRRPTGCVLSPTARRLTASVPRLPVTTTSGQPLADAAGRGRRPGVPGLGRGAALDLAPGPVCRRAGRLGRQPRCRRRSPGGRPPSARPSTEAQRTAGCARSRSWPGRSAPATPPTLCVQRLRAAGHDVVLVECGWPRGGADVETFGGSPAVARALLAVLRGEVSA